MRTYYIAQGALLSALWWLKLGRKSKREGMYVYLFHFAVQQKLTQHCKVTISSVAQSCPTLWDPMNRSTPGLPVHHQLPEFTQTLLQEKRLFKDVVHIYIIYYSGIKRGWNLAFAATWMDLRRTMLSEISHTNMKKTNPVYHLHVESENYN